MDRFAIDRRIDFLLSEAASSHPVYDQSVRMTMRVISIWVSCGKDVSSSCFKKLAVYMSNKAHAFRGDLNDYKLFASQKINEHPEELKIIWNWMIEKRGKIDDDLRKRKAGGPEALMMESN